MLVEITNKPIEFTVTATVVDGQGYLIDVQVDRRARMGVEEVRLALALCGTHASSIDCVERCEDGTGHWAYVDDHGNKGEVFTCPNTVDVYGRVFMSLAEVGWY